MGIHSGMNITAAVFTAIPFVLAAMGGFALNDYTDRIKDAINRPYRPIPSGRISPRRAWWVGWGLLTIATGSAAYLSRSAGDILVFAATISGVAAYNTVVSRATVLKNLWTGGLCALPFVYFCLKGRVPAAIPLGIGLFVVGRELLMDIVDVSGDMASGIRTIAARCGFTKSSVMAFSLMAVAIFFFLGVMRSYLVEIALSGAMLAAVVLWCSGRGRFRKDVVYLLWLPMLIGCVAFFN
jgi:geranylgeranylglycerol-phosphate geranylgeranyltransferase